MKDFLKQVFIKEFNMEMVAEDLLDMMKSKQLEQYIIDKFNENFMYGELYDLFMRETKNKDQTKLLLTKMGHNFVDLDTICAKKREFYY